MSHGLVHRIEIGGMGCAIGAAFELAAIVGVPLFGAEPTPLTRQLATVRQTGPVAEKSAQKHDNGEERLLIVGHLLETVCAQWNAICEKVNPSGMDYNLFWERMFLKSFISERYNNIKKQPRFTLSSSFYCKNIT